MESLEGSSSRLQERVGPCCLLGPGTRLVNGQISDQSKLQRQSVNVSLFKVMEVDRMIQDIVVEHEGAEYRYRDVCAKWAGHCRSVVREILSEI